MKCMLIHKINNKLMNKTCKRGRQKKKFLIENKEKRSTNFAINTVIVYCMLYMYKLLT